MDNKFDLVDFFAGKPYKLILVADAETFVNKKNKNGEIVSEIPAGGVAVAFDPIASASHGLFIGRGKTEEDKQVMHNKGKITSPDNSYTLKRLFFPTDLLHEYYEGFSNQTLWPLCHVAFESPIFSSHWYKGFKQVNETFAKAIKEELKEKTLVWINDYQLSLVPHFLGRQKDTMIGFFWHIPWPTWEVFRILPQKKEILESLLHCDFIGFHRGYQARNFLRCVERELEARIDLETNKVYYKNHITTVKNLPMGVDTDVIKSLIKPIPKKSLIARILHRDKPNENETIIDRLFATSKVMLGVDRLDYTKGLTLRFQAIDKFFDEFPHYREKVSYVSILAPSRQDIPSYILLKEHMITAIKAINQKHATKHWQPINLVTGIFSRSDIMNFYSQAALCLVTPRDDGMNLVSKEFVMSASTVDNPGMLVLSQFAGSAIDLTQSLIVNPYDIDEVVAAIKKGLEMPTKEKRQRIQTMASILEQRNVYKWAADFINETESAAKENQTP